MNDLVNMSVNLKVPNTKINNTSKETLRTEKSNIDKISQKNHSSNFKKILNKANEKTNLKNSEVSKDEEIEDVKNDSSKEVKSKKDVLDLILISLLQHLGDDKSMEELNDSISQDAINNNICDIETLKSSNNLQKSVADIINVLLEEGKGSNNENSKLQELLSKMKSINDEDINNLNIKEAINDLKSTFMEASKEVKQDSFMKENILNLIKDKLNESSMDKNNGLNIMESFRSNDSLKTVTQMENFNSDSNAGYENKEEEFLKGLTSNNKSKLESRLDKVTNFMNDFNKINSEISTNKVEAEAPININKNNLVNDFIKSVKYMEQNNVREMTVKVKPQELGEVVIRITVENGLMKANITANNKEAYNLLNSKLQDLNNSLGNGEIKIQNFTIDIYNGDTTFFSRENSKEQRNNANGNSRGKNSGVLKVEESLNSNDEIQNHLEDSNVNAFV
ncbi:MULTISPECIES: flagellar hook-length control protein FliK [Clostridium]|uniref:flagellar hook-length control protein FliK n=1 Tax=Clostridium TaxID=1485 RepID=UPI0004D46D18|nr:MULTISPECIES: flagellar hook-length control protein FliK [Clostridium]KEH87943.1 hypothetical protein Z967_02740 [Clostridium novyi A str. 4540]KEH93472.1 hypothetical protein Z963_02010 [Clostridium botulinum C/D str. It1]KEH94572.1 hypothetical protein Z964_00960 [Clostridium novyi A str. GD211209]